MSVRTDGFFWDYLFGRRERTNAAAQQQHRAQMMMAAENRERVERAQQKHAEVQGYGVADLAQLAARLNAWPMDGGHPCDEAHWRALVAKRLELEALLWGAPKQNRSVSSRFPGAA